MYAGTHPGVSVRTFTVRPATKDDAPALARLARATFVETCAPYYAPEELASYAMTAFDAPRIAYEMNQPDTRFLLAIDHAGTLCGYAKLEPSPVPTPVVKPHPIEFARLYAAPERIGRDVGALLMQHSLDTARAMGYLTCWLRVWDGNAQAITFYHRWGFVPVGSQIDRRGSASATALLMALSL